MSFAEKTKDKNKTKQHIRVLSQMICQALVMQLDSSGSLILVGSNYIYILVWSKAKDAYLMSVAVEGDWSLISDEGPAHLVLSHFLCRALL